MGLKKQSMKQVSNAIKKKFETTAKLCDKQNRIMLVIILGVIILLLILVPFLPDNGSEIIRERLSQQGFDVEFFTFERTDEKFRSIYKASEPIDIGAGTYVEFWEILNISFSPMGIPRYIVKPFPEVAVPAKFTISFEISEHEYEKLKEITMGESMGEFTKQLLLQYIQVE